MLAKSVKIAVAALLIIIGAIRGATLSELSSKAPEYSIAIFTGLFFGWALSHGISRAFKFGHGGETKIVAIIGIISPLLVLIMAHQTRSFLSDGPIAIALGLSLAIFSLLPSKGANS